MRKDEKEVIQSALESEAKVLKDLESNYIDALASIKERVKVLMADAERTGLQSKIYQLQYQQNLQKQIERCLQVLQSKNFATVNEYLNQCYTDGVVGTAYSLQHQNVPLTIPIDQNKVLTAVEKSVGDFKLSDRIYNNVAELQKAVQAEISRGISTNLSYTDIARNIAGRSEANLFRAMTIARTEGHRVQNEAKMDALRYAKAKGADIVKQWDATLDSATRDTHRLLDGQVRELDEDFTVLGASAPYPGGFGDPAEDCNCRCCMLQRARWAVEGETTYDKWNNETGGIIQCTGYDDFKEKYLDILTQSDIIKTTAANGIAVESIAVHTLERAEERGITSAAIKDALEQPLHIGDTVVDDCGRKSQRFVGNIATVNVNPVSGKITTVWRTGKATKRKYRKGE